MSVVDVARRLAELRPGHPVLSVYLDLDPERFATAPARASQVHSLIDGAARDVKRSGASSHEDRVSLRADLERVRGYLLSREPPFKGARALALFCCGPIQLFEVVQLRRPVEGRAVIEQAPFIEPLVTAAPHRRWGAVLLNRREALMLVGEPDSLRELGRLEDHVHGQHEQGGWSQANYQRSVEKDADDHVRHVAEAVERQWRADHFDRLAVGGPPEIVPRLEAMLGDELRALLVGERLEVDLSSATEGRVQAAIARLAREDDRRLERSALDQLAAGVGAGGRAAARPEDTVEALNERRVGTLLISEDFDRAALRCPTCGMLLLDRDGQCPADGSAPEIIDHLREAVVESAIAQDAEVLVVTHYPDLDRLQGIGALLRF